MCVYKIKNGSKKSSEIVLGDSLLQVLLVQRGFLAFDDSLDKILLVLKQLLPLPCHCRPPLGHPLGGEQQERRSQHHHHYGVVVIIDRKDIPEGPQGRLEKRELLNRGLPHNGNRNQQLLTTHRSSTLCPLFPKRSLISLSEKDEVRKLIMSVTGKKRPNSK